MKRSQTKTPDALDALPPEPPGALPARAETYSPPAAGQSAKAPPAPRPAEILARHLAIHRDVVALLGHPAVDRYVTIGGNDGISLRWPNGDDAKLEAAESLPLLRDALGLYGRITRAMRKKATPPDVRQLAFASISLARRDAKPADAMALVDELDLMVAERPFAPAILASAVWRHRQRSPFPPALSELVGRMDEAWSDFTLARGVADLLAEELGRELDRRWAAGLPDFPDGYDGDENDW